MSYSHRILLADDDREVRLGVADLLMGLGLEILHAETGLEAVEVARAQRIHAALLDMHMPGCTGMEALSLLLREQIELPCIVYSGRWSPGLERMVLEAGAMACLKKPVEPHALRREVCRALRLDVSSLWKPEDRN
jgi:CheY-like chemotaxis protein